MIASAAPLMNPYFIVPKSFIFPDIFAICRTSSSVRCLDATRITLGVKIMGLPTYLPIYRPGQQLSRQKLPSSTKRTTGYEHVRQNRGR